MTDLAEDLIEWYDRSARDLPWRRPGTTPWAVLVSEVMLQQTPVARVEPVYGEWLARWPDAAALAAASTADVLRAWGRLGYPRRALRLQSAAVVVVERHGGELPRSVAELEALPGIGTYTARAIAAFAFGQRVPVVDTNVRRVVARAVAGQAEAEPPSTRRDLAAAEALLPAVPGRAARLSIALMELGALVCTARSPRCGDCPVSERCAWSAAGRPSYRGPVAVRQRFTGTDRQVRGLLMAVLRNSPGAVPAGALDAVWPDPVQRARALDGLVADGLVEPLAEDRYALPS